MTNLFTTTGITSITSTTSTAAASICSLELSGHVSTSHPQPTTTKYIYAKLLMCTQQGFQAHIGSSGIYIGVCAFMIYFTV
jgi:hypothetical protein